MKKKLSIIIIFFIIILAISCGDSKATVATDLEIQLATWDGLNSDMTEEEREARAEEILKKLQDILGYTNDRNRVENEMIISTKITLIEKKQTWESYLPWNETTYQYTIRIRLRI